MKNIILALLFNFNLFAQECKYKEYFTIIDIAHKEYLAKDYKNCENNLKLAFSKVDFPLGKDLNIALNVCQLRKNEKWAEEISVQLAKGGVPLRYFEKLNSYKWFSNFKNNFPTYTEHYNKNFKPELRQELNLLIEKDKKFNERWHSFRTGDIEMTLQGLIDGSYEILNQFNKIIENYGFPFEKLIGYNYDVRRNTVEIFCTNCLLNHITGRGVKVFTFLKLEEISCNGGLQTNFIESTKNLKDLEIAPVLNKK